MALLWIEGFEGFGDTDDAAPSPVGIIEKKYQAVSGSANMKIQAGRFGHCLEIRPDKLDWIQSPPLTTDRTTIIGGVIKFDSLPSSYSPFFILYDGPTWGISAGLNPDGTISVATASLTPLGVPIYAQLDVSTKILNLGQRYHIEMKVYTHSSAGTVGVRVDEENWISVTEEDTECGSNPYHNSFRLGVSGAWISYDDVYFLDGTGTINNDFLGVQKVTVIRPDAAGDSSQWIPNSGVNYDRVNESELDEDNSYVETATTTDKDLYNYSSVGNLSSITGIQILCSARVTSGRMELQAVTKSGATEDTQSCMILVLSEEYKTCSVVGELNPDTSLPWTPAEIDAAQFGVKAI